MVMDVDFTRRERQIVKVLLEGPTTAEKISNRLGVSRRTVLRDLPGLSEKLGDLGIKLCRKSGKGISLEGESDSLERLKQELEKSPEEEGIGPAERQKLIMLFLLEKKEPQKLYSLSQEFGVTESTISNDLDKVERMLSGYGLKLVRRPGLGVFIKGPERNIRQLITDLFYEHFDETWLVRLMRENLQGSASENVINRFFGFIEKEWLKEIEIILKKTMEESGINLADSAFLGLLVHIALALKRLKNGEAISMDEGVLSGLKETREFQLAARLAGRLRSAFGMEIPEEELGYITMHLLGAKLRGGQEDFRELFAMSHREAVKASLEVLKEAGRELNKDLAKDPRVVEDLAIHLKPAIARMKMGMEIRNPILSQIKEEYPDLMSAAAKAARTLEKRFGVKVPEEEMGYIAMHLGAALEREGGKAGVVMVCPSGLGSARMLASRIKKELPDLEIIDVVSALDLEKTLVKHPEVDAVISTVPLEEQRRPVIVVSPLLTSEDVECIRAFVRKGTPLGRKSQKEQSTCEDVVFKILDGFLLEKIEAKDLNELLDAVEEKIRLSPRVLSPLEIKRAIYERELKSGTAVPGVGISLLHARTDGVKAPLLGIFRLEEPVRMENMDGKMEDVEACVVMLLPKDSSPQEVERMGRISAALIDEEGFAELVKSGTALDVIKALLKILR